MVNSKTLDNRLRFEAHRSTFQDLLDHGFEPNSGRDPLVVLLESRSQEAVLYPPGILHPLQINHKRLATRTRFFEAVGPFVRRAQTKTNNDGWSSYDIIDWQGFRNELLSRAPSSGVRPTTGRKWFKTAADRMAATALATVLASQAGPATRKMKLKELGFANEKELSSYISGLLQEQKWKCKITQIPLREDIDTIDSELKPSLDRIDSNAHYTVGNLQIVCRFINRWKRAEDSEQFARLIKLLKSPA